MNQITSNPLHGGRRSARGRPSPEGPNERAVASERVDPVMGLHWDFERISKEVTDRVAAGAAAVNAPLPSGTSLKFPSRILRPFDLLAEYLGKPGSVVTRHGDRDHDLIVLRGDPTRLTDQNAGLYYEAVARTLQGAFGPPRPRPVAGPQTLREVLRDICAYLIAGANLGGAGKDVRYVSSWRNALDKAGVDPYGFLTGPVANRVVFGTVGNGAACGDEHWSLDTAHALLSVIVDALGEGAVEDFADDLRARCALADGGTSPGEFEAVDGKLLVAILGLARFRDINPHHPASFGEVFGADSEQLAHRLRAWCWLWTGSEGDAGRPVARRLADIVLRQVGWIREWHGKAQGDALLSALRKEPNAFPRRLAVSAPLPAVTTVAPSWPAAADAAPPAPPSAEEGEAAGTAADAAPPPPPPAKEGEAAGDGAPEGFRLLQPDERYGFAPIDVGIIGGSGVGKTTFLRAVHHDLMERRSELFPGAGELVLADRCSEAIRDDIQSWSEGENTSSTPETVLDYALELPRLMTIRLIDHRGALLDLRRDPGRVAGEGDDRLLTETLKEVDGIAALISVESLVKEARGDAVAAHQRVPEVDAIADRLGRMLSGRQSDHVPLVLVVNKLDEILTNDEGFRSMYEHGAVFGDGVSGGHLPRVEPEELTEWSVRQPIATRSLAAQSIVSRSLKVLAPVCAQLAAHTRRIELFFTSSKPVEPADKQEDRAVSSAGPAAVVSWLLKDNLVPAFLEQAKARIASDRETVASARKDHDVVRSLAKLVAVDPRAGAALSMLPGVNKVVRKMRARRIGLLAEILRRYGIELPKDPSNDELFSARDRLEARIDHSTAEIDAMKRRLDEFAARFGRAAQP